VTKGEGELKGLSETRGDRGGLLTKVIWATAPEQNGEKSILWWVAIDPVKQGGEKYYTAMIFFSLLTELRAR